MLAQTKWRTTTPRIYLSPRFLLGRCGAFLTMFPSVQPSKRAPILALPSTGQAKGLEDAVITEQAMLQHIPSQQSVNPASQE